MTPQEHKVLSCLRSYAPEAATNEAILKALDKNVVSDTLISSTVYNIKKKMSVCADGRVEIINDRKGGYKLVEKKPRVAE